MKDADMNNPPESAKRFGMHLVWLMAVVLVCTHCVPLSRGPVPLSRHTLDRLSARAITADEAGLKSRDGTHWQLTNGYRVVSADSGVMPFVSKYRAYTRMPIIRVKLNGHETYAVIDTGSSISLIDCRLARRSGVQPVLKASLPGEETSSFKPFMTGSSHTAGGEASFFITRCDTLQIGKARIENVLIGVPDDARGLGMLGWIEGYRVEALIGLDILRHFPAVTFDFPRESFQTGPAPARLKNAGTIKLRQSGALAITLGMLDNHPPVFPVAFDTGGDFGLWMPAAIARKLHLNSQAGAARYGASIVNASSARQIGAHNLRIGNTRIVAIPTTVQVDDRAGPAMPYALLGLQALTSQRVTFLFPSHRVVME